jgi:DNA-binding MarR family transcriptional regulator
MQTGRASQIVQQETRQALRPDLLGMRLMMLMRLLRESGAPHYEREIGYKDIERQLILMVGQSGGLSSQEIVALTGYEKAQVSRAIKPLERDGIIHREKLRAKLTLSERGRALFQGILDIARVRDGELTKGIAAADLQRFATLTDELTQQAARIYANERCRSAKSGLIVSAHPAGPMPWPRGLEGGGAERSSILILPKIFGLVAYLKRSAMLVYQRTQGLSNFQGQVLFLIGKYPPLPMAKLILTMGRDKSQIGRTVSNLEQSGLVRRFRPSSRRDIMLELTERGTAVHQEVCALAVQRDEALWSGHSADDHEFYGVMVDQLFEQARTMIEAAKGVPAQRGDR